MFAAEWMDWTGLDATKSSVGSGDPWGQGLPVRGGHLCRGKSGREGCARSWAPAARAQKREDLMFNINVSWNVPWPSPGSAPRGVFHQRTWLGWSIIQDTSESLLQGASRARDLHWESRWPRSWCRVTRLGSCAFTTRLLIIICPFCCVWTEREIWSYLS